MLQTCKTDIPFGGLEGHVFISWTKRLESGAFGWSWTKTDIPMEERADKCDIPFENICATVGVTT
jgi:hypothetical protein